MIRFFLPIFVFCAFAAPAFAQNEGTTAPKPPAPPVVMELFTSQSCGFCPPADALIGQMAQQENIIALACHVDYFKVAENSLGKSFCTRRQNDYNKIIAPGPRYTPQLVVNGHMDMIGYETGKVSAAVLKARGEKIAPITITNVGDSTYSFSLRAIALKGADVRLWMAVFDTPKTLSMVEGSNFGKQLTYYNVVSKIDDLGAWDGAAITQSLSVPLSADNAGFAVIAQNVKTGNIIAAGDLRR